MNKIVALKGKANTGKTSTIKKVYELLVKKYQPAPSKDSIMKTDIRTILTINGIKIGIESLGDPSNRLPASLKLFRRTGCQIIVCATRSKGNTVKAVQKLEKSYDILWLNKEVEPIGERDKKNLAIAKYIVKEVDKHLLA